MRSGESLRRLMGWGHIVEVEEGRTLVAVVAGRVVVEESVQPAEVLGAEWMVVVVLHGNCLRQKSLLRRRESYRLIVTFGPILPH
jgi:hypothetical protein